MKILAAVLFFVFALCFDIPAKAQSNAQETYLLDTARQIHDVTQFLFIYEDLQGQERLPEIREKEDHFVRLDSFTNKKKKKGVYWIRLSIYPQHRVENWQLILKTVDKNYEYFSSWEILEAVLIDTAGNVIDRQNNGLYTPSSERRGYVYAGLSHVVLNLKASVPYTVFIRLQDVFIAHDPALIEAEIRNPDINIPSNTIMILLPVMLGVTTCLGIMSLFFYLFVRDKAYLFFFIYLSFLALHYLILHPHMPFVKWFIPEQPQLAFYFFSILAFGSFIMFFLFGRYFINLRALSPKTDKLLVWYLIVWAGFIVLHLGSMALFQKVILQGAFYLFIIAGIGFMIRFAFFKSILARFFVAGALWLFLFSLLGVLDNNDIIDPPFSPWPVAQLGQLMIYMAGLAYKIRLNEHAKYEALRIRELDSIKSRFFANISHEFRTPLTLIRGMLQQIEERVAPKKIEEDNITITRRQIDVMHRHADRLLELVNQLLDLSKLDAGKMKLQIIRGDVLQALRVLAHSFDSLAERKQIYYHVHFPDQTPVVFFDQDKLEKIVVNLLGNAFKYTPEKGNVSVEVTLDEERLRIAIKDSGPGIPKKELDKVFDRYYQVEGHEDKGSGIGLALVKELTDLYRGQISVSSDPGKGTQFRVSLPVSRSAFHENEFIYGENLVEKHEHIISPDHSYEVESDTLNHHLPLLLVVEDNADLRQFIHESMQSSFRVIEATNGAEGITKAVELVPDIVVSDVMMPGMDGFAFTEKLKKDDRTSHIPVILLTAKAGQSHKIEGLEKGADDYLTKPFDTRELLVRAQNLIEGRNMLRQKFAVQLTIKPSEVKAQSLDQLFLVKVMEAVEANMQNEDFGVEELAHELAMSRSQLHRKLIALLGKSPSEILRQTRLIRAKELLQKKATTPAEVAFQVGFNSHSYFTKCFKEEFGMNPSEVG